jgi:hypothetical protein
VHEIDLEAGVWELEHTPHETSTVANRAKGCTHAGRPIGHLKYGLAH